MVKSLTLIALLLLLSLLLPCLSLSADLLQKGIEQYRKENYEEALEILKEAYKISPTTVVSFYIGLTYKQTGDLRKAKQFFIESLTKTPKVFDAYVELIEVLHSLDEIEEAKKWLREAKTERVMPPKIAYLEGLLLLKENKNKEAIKAFEESKRLDPTLTQVADVQIAIALSRERKITEAINLLKAIIQIDPTSEIAEFSKDYITTLERLKEQFREWRISINFGYTFDDNVVSKPSTPIGVPAVDEPTGVRDSSFSGNFRLSFRPNISGNFLMSSDLTLFTRRYTKNQTQNTYSLTYTLTPGYGFKTGAITIPLEFYYSTLDDEKYMTITSLRPTLNLQVLEPLIFQLSLGFAKRDMLRYIVGADPDEDRDSNLYNSLLGLYFNFDDGKGLLWTRYEFQVDSTEGKNWHSNSHRLAFGLIYRIIEKLNITSSLDYTFQKFKNISTLSGIGLPGFPDTPKKRDDRVLNLTAGLSYDLFRNAKINFSYTHSRTNSNFPIYQFRRNLYNVDFSLNF